MRLSAAIVIACCCLASGRRADADGKFFSREEVPPGVPYQRALLVFDGAQETLVLQSRYRSVGGVSDLGWVVPLPAPPDVTSLDPHEAGQLFLDLDASSTPRDRRVSEVLLFALWFGTVGLLAVTLTAWAFPGSSVRRYRGRLLALSAIGVVVFTVPQFLAVKMMSAHFPGVEVLKEASVGIYDVKVVRSSDGGALVSWLASEGFRRGPEDEPAISAYVERGWCFVAAKVSAARAARTDATDHQGLVAPLLVRFPTPRAVYPLALTGTAGEDTEIVLYAWGPHRFAADGRMDVHFAGPDPHVDAHLMEEEAAGWLAKDFPGGGWLTKFKGRLTASQMREDLLLDFAATDEAERRTVWRW